MRIAGRRDDEFEINVVSLIDVLLTLLMFFVLTTTFVQQGHLKVSLPQASAQPQPAERNTLVLVIDRSGHFYVGNNRVLGNDEDSLKRAIRAIAGDDHERPVLLRADGLATQQSVVTAMDALAQLGFTHLSIATTQHAGQDGQ